MGIASARIGSELVAAVVLTDAQTDGVERNDAVLQPATWSDVEDLERDLERLRKKTQIG